MRVTSPSGDYWPWKAGNRQPHYALGRGLSLQARFRVPAVVGLRAARPACWPVHVLASLSASAAVRGRC